MSSHLRAAAYPPIEASVKRNQLKTHAPGKQLLLGNDINKGPSFLSGDLPQHLLQRACVKDMISHADEIGCISFRLPKPNALAGAVLNHCIQVVEHILEKKYPLIFKIGFTHNAVWRWKNEIYGYAVSRDKWSHMVVLHIADEQFSVAMLEAALIERFRGILS